MPENEDPCVMPYTPNGFFVCAANAATSAAPTSDGPEPWRRKSAHSTAAASSGFDARPFSPSVPLTMRRDGNRRCSIAATSGERSAEAQSIVSASGM